MPSILKNLIKKASYVYDVYERHIHDPLTDFLLDSYQPLEIDINHKIQWEEELQARVGAPDMRPVIETPAALLVAVTKNYIQADPRIVGLTAWTLDTIIQGSIPLTEAQQTKIKEDLSIYFMPAQLEPLSSEQLANLTKLSPAQLRELAQLPPETFAKQILIEILSVHFSKERLDDLSLEQLEKLVKLPTGEQQKLSRLSPDAFEKQLAQQIFLPQMSQEGLANWIVDSAQAMLHTEDPHLLGLGQFIQQRLHYLTLGLMAKGAKLVIPEEEEIEENQFIKELTDRLVEKFGSLQGKESISDQFWLDFVKDLPLPPFVKDLIVPVLIQKTKTWQSELRTSPDLQEIQRVYSESEAIIRSYEGGEQLLSITEKVSEQIIEQVLEKNVGLITALGLGNTLEELFAQYLPGIKINAELTKWFKENISALGATEAGQSPQSVILLKQGIQAILRKALVNTIETNFKNNSKDYAAQLLQNLQQAFAKAFAGFNPAQRTELGEALSIQTHIKAHVDRINTLKEQMVAKPQDITPDQFSLLEEVIHAHIRYTRASDYLEELVQKREGVMVELNKKYVKPVWAADQLPYISRALTLQKIQSSNFPTLEAHLAELRKEVGELQKMIESKEVVADRDIFEELAEREVLVALLDMSPEELHLISEALNIESTLQHAKKELEHLKEELEDREGVVSQQDQAQLQNQPAWNQAKQWVQQTLTHRQEIHQLSKEVIELGKQLDTHLQVFQALADELTALLGLNEKEKLDLPPFLQNTIWPIIESAKKQHIARLLFEQLTPLLLPIVDIPETRARLIQLAKGNQFFAQLAQAASKEVISRIPEFVTSYKPFAEQILTVMGVDNPTPEEIVRMESALKHRLIELGKEGTVASMLQPLFKGLVPVAKEAVLSHSLEQLIIQSKDPQISNDQILLLLQKEIVTVNKKEEQQLEKQAQLLASSVNQFLLNRGKAKIKAEDLLDAYQQQIIGAQQAIQPAQVGGILQALQSEHILDKIKNIVITPEEIAQALDDVIPGATDLHTLIAPQLQAAIVGEDAAFKENREILQQYVEGMLLKIFVKVAEANQEGNQDVLAVLTRKLRDLPLNAETIKDKNSEEIARQMIDQLLQDVLGIASQHDLEGIPLALQKIAYEKIKEQAYQQLMFLMVPIIERAKNRKQLKLQSGSKFLGHLCEALTKDIFHLLPAG